MSPELAIDPAGIAAQDIPALASSIARYLRGYPHYVRLTGPAPTQKRGPVRDLCRAIATMEPVQPGLTGQTRNRISFTRVRINPDKAETNRLSTAYSRTHKPLELPPIPPSRRLRTSWLPSRWCRPTAPAGTRY